ncbi:MAG: TPM domain-containing protein [Tannerellaceae bacterium]|nr:TPM domain-containing protein [Tannerellaceae bacterium]
MNGQINIQPLPYARKGWVTLWVLCSLLLAGGVYAAEYSLESIPNVRLSNRYNYVSNPDGIISAPDVARINQLLKTLEDSLSIEVAVVAIESIGENDARMFATDLFKLWGIGKREDDNGLLIQLVTEPSQRSVVFETGYGLEGVLPDAICYRIQQRYMIPDMRNGDYSAGMVKGIAAVKEYLMASDYERKAIIGANGQGELDDSLFLLLIIGVIAVPVGIMLLLTFFKYRPKKCPRCGKKALVYSGQRIVQQATYKAQGMAVDIYRCKNCGYTENRNKTLPRLRSNAGPLIIGGGMGGMGRGSRGGGFGGGFGGGSFGGGRSGGGGSISRF